MISLKRKEQGFTIVELLIVIVVIGILAALVITTFSGIQKKARNGERKTDIQAVASQLEAYAAQNGRYPTLANLNDDTWVGANLKGLDLEALADPKGASNDLSATAGANVYAYVETPAGCDNDPATATADCTDFVLTATGEDETIPAKNGLLN